MEIRVKNESVYVEYHLDEDARASEILTALTSAMMAQEYAIGSIAEAMREHANCLMLECKEASRKDE